MKRRVTALILTIVLLISLSSCTWVGRDQLYHGASTGGFVTSSVFVTAQVMTVSKLSQIKIPKIVADNMNPYLQYGLYKILGMNPIKKGETIEVKVSIAQSGYSTCDYAELKINARNFVITAPDGTEHRERYMLEYTDFDDERYKLSEEDGKRIYPYSETFYFRYDPIENEGSIGSIGFYLEADYVKNEEPADNLTRRDTVNSCSLLFRIKKRYLFF